MWSWASGSKLLWDGTSSPSNEKGSVSCPGDLKEFKEFSALREKYRVQKAIALGKAVHSSVLSVTFVVSTSVLLGATAGETFGAAGNMSTA